MNRQQNGVGRESGTRSANQTNVALLLAKMRRENKNVVDLNVEAEWVEPNNVAIVRLKRFARQRTQLGASSRRAANPKANTALTATVTGSTNSIRP
jgi:hypothetical protein